MTASEKPQKSDGFKPKIYVEDDVVIWENPSVILAVRKSDLFDPGKEEEICASIKQQQTQQLGATRARIYNREENIKEQLKIVRENTQPLTDEEREKIEEASNKFYEEFDKLPDFIKKWFENHPDERIFIKTTSGLFAPVLKIPGVEKIFPPHSELFDTTNPPRQDLLTNSVIFINHSFPGIFTEQEAWKHFTREYVLNWHSEESPDTTDADRKAIARILEDISEVHLVSEDRELDDGICEDGECGFEEPKEARQDALIDMVIHYHENNGKFPEWANDGMKEMFTGGEDKKGTYKIVFDPEKEDLYKINTHGGIPASSPCHPCTSFMQFCKGIVHEKVPQRISQQGGFRRSY